MGVKKLSSVFAFLTLFRNILPDSEVSKQAFYPHGFYGQSEIVHGVPILSEGKLEIIEYLLGWSFVSIFSSILTAAL